MMKSYGITLQGTYHKKINLICQDYHCIKKINDDLIIASVADGLGSEEHSDIASKIASEKSVEYCSKEFKNDLSTDEVLDIIKKSFLYSLAEIEKYVKEKNDNLNQYDTTLCLVIFSKDIVFYGQSGDSGAVILQKNGIYEKLTEQQRDENGYVFPLICGEEKWVFGSKNDIASVLLATDGVLELLFPSLLFGENPNIYVALAQYFMDNKSLGFGEISDEEIKEKRKFFLEKLSDDQINDDKTLVVLNNINIIVNRQEESYYSVPDWQALKKKKEEEFRRLAYPHLFKEEQEN